MERDNISIYQSATLFISVAVGAFAVCLNAAELNLLYYAYHGPFYDSMDYLNRAAVVMDGVRKDGLMHSLSLNTKNTTVFLPWLQAALLSVFLEKNRIIAIWIQAPWLILLAITSSYYFKCNSKLNNFISASYSVVIITFHQIFYFNGGLSDFRMDLLQALTFCSAAIMYLLAISRNGFLLWILFGFLLSIACLARATTPVYAVIVFGPFALFDVLFRKNNIFYFKRYLLSVSLVAILSGWFYLKNFQYLYYYYFIWNEDAKIHLPLSVSWQHLQFVYNHIGFPVVILLSVIFLINISCRILTKCFFISDINWRSLWIAIAPVGYLVFSGAGLNPFISIVSVPSTILFMLAPFKNTNINNKNYSIVIGAFSLIISLISASSGLSSHKENVSPGLVTNSALTKITDRLLIYAEAEKVPISFQVMFIGSIDAPTIINKLAFDLNFNLNSSLCASKNAVSLYFINGSYAQPAEWNSIAGETDLAKEKTIAINAMSKADILIIPEPTSKLVQHVPINQHAFEIRQLLLESEGIESLGEAIELTPTELVRIYTNKNKKFDYNTNMSGC